MQRIEYSLSEDDFMAYARYHFRRSEYARGMMRRNLVVGVVLLILVAIGAKDDAYYGWREPAHFALRLGAAAAMFGGLLFLYQRAVQPMLVRGWVHTNAPRMLGATELDVQDDGVFVSNTEGKGRLGWEACQGVINDGEHIYIIMGKLRAFVVPKRAFATPAAANTFYEAAATRYRKAQPAKIGKA